ncbi:MAG: CysZ protein [Lentimonas sp.]|jgi:CysZ protein
MKTIGHHFMALKWTFNRFFQGKFLLFLIPGFLFALIFWQIFDWSHSLHGGQENYSSFDWLNNTLNTTVEYSLSFFEFLLNQVYVFFVLTLLSPVNTYLSEKVDEELTGQTVGFDILRFVNELLRMILIVIIALSLEFLLMGVWWIFSWVFSLEETNTFVFFLITAFFYGFAFYDYSLERYEISVGGSLRFAKKFFLPVLVSGIIFSLLILIPVFGLAFAPVIATIYTTYVFLKANGKLDKQSTINE